MNRVPEGPVDVVYTWVDDQFPGYREQLLQYASRKRDGDPSRTRDNLETLRFSLRSIERYAPWINRVYLLTCRPQVPPWLETAHPKLAVVHHDQVMPPEILPTFNSLAIISHLHRIPDLTRKFIYLEDDMLFLAPVAYGDFVAPDGRLKVFEEPHAAPRLEEISDPSRAGGWNLALAHSNALLDQKFGKKARSQVNHSPLLIDKFDWAETLALFPESAAATVRSRFRSEGNLAPEYLYPQRLLAEGRAHFVKHRQARETVGYVPLEDFWPITAWRLRQVRRRRPKWVTLNDNFGQVPNARTVAMMRRQLHDWFPDACSFERRNRD